MNSVFRVGEFVFPYRDLKFPGQSSDERILYITREATVMLWLRMLMIVLVVAVLVIMGMGLPLLVAQAGVEGIGLVSVAVLFLAGLFMGVGGWWVYTLWKKSVFILTNRRLTKFIYTTPWNRYNLSLGLDKIEDTGAYGRGYFQAMTGIGTFTARSSAGNRKEKYFYIENIHAYEDLANYVNKLLFHFERNLERLDSFRPFIPEMKGERRKKYMKKFPEFWS